MLNFLAIFFIIIFNVGAFMNINKVFLCALFVCGSVVAIENDDKAKQSVLASMYSNKPHPVNVEPEGDDLIPKLSSWFIRVPSAESLKSAFKTFGFDGDQYDKLADEIGDGYVDVIGYDNSTVERKIRSFIGEEFKSAGVSSIDEGIKLMGRLHSILYALDKDYVDFDLVNNKILIEQLHSNDDKFGVLDLREVMARQTFLERILSRFESGTYQYPPRKNRKVGFINPPGEEAPSVVQSVEPTERKTILMPVQKILEERLLKVVDAYFLEKTQLDVKLSDRELYPMGVNVVVTLAIYDFIERFKGDSVMTAVISMSMRDLKPEILKALFIGHETELEKMNQEFSEEA